MLTSTAFGTPWITNLHGAGAITRIPSYHLARKYFFVKGVDIHAFPALSREIR